MSAWSCPHDIDNICQRVQGASCEPGMRGCVLAGRVRFANEQMNLPRKPVRAEAVSTPDEQTAKPARRRLPF
ncbi:hypothetical protein OPU71_06795 [Niveibacterium sp. 24ML]|uniref:hypothetical protein n=1 Tax=Niveibacterium sp. 24ML TaxID=2985512 RepID=UPI00226FF618|nr:hypothetical protein [Niveibacterium sp. 24ML]MCX9155834.1 hypothetical protein [Niveibacterium sp. 24ML]